MSHIFPQILRRKRLLCQDSLIKSAKQQQQLLQQQLLQQQQCPGGTPSGSSTVTAPTASAGGTEYVMAREAFSWLLKDLRAQLCSLVLEFLFLVDGGLLSNAAHEAAIRSSNDNARSKGSKSSNKTNSNSWAEEGSTAGEDMDQESSRGASAALVEIKQREVAAFFLAALS